MNGLCQSQQIYSDQNFSGGMLDHHQLQSSEFYDCTFVNSPFVEAVFKECRFINCTFRNCDLSLVKVTGSSFSSAIFKDSKVIGVDWTRASWGSADLGTPVNFTGCVMNHSTFIGLNLSGIKILDCSAMGVDFREADLSRADFTGTDLSECLFGNTNLSCADLSRARNYHILPAENTLKGTRFSMPEALSLLYNLDIVLTGEEIA